MDKENLLHIHNEILFSHKRNEILSFVTTWMELEIIMLSKISQRQKDKYHMISLIGGMLKANLIEVKVQLGYQRLRMMKKGKNGERLMSGY
jgi:hypothetical protein